MRSRELDRERERERVGVRFPRLPRPGGGAISFWSNCGAGNIGNIGGSRFEVGPTGCVLASLDVAEEEAEFFFLSFRPNALLKKPPRRLGGASDSVGMHFLGEIVALTGEFRFNGFCFPGELSISETSIFPGST